MKHHIKCWPQYFCRVFDGSKTFEVRKNDRGYQPGDEVVMQEFDPDVCKGEGRHTGRAITFKVGYVYPLDADRVVFSILRPPVESKPAAPEEK